MSRPTAYDIAKQRRDAEAVAKYGPKPAPPPLEQLQLEYGKDVKVGVVFHSSLAEAWTLLIRRRAGRSWRFVRFIYEEGSWREKTLI